ncbi:MAG TPA: cellulase N-terminal Ig-like domain-containing protein [Mycobacteriales bacterium]|nr:cellulase N-terminal Ig-like domain-containing protein [Mycobacteriales bacterium]
MRVNQVGFLPDGPTAATVLGPPVPFAVRSGDRTVLSGVTAGKVADLSALRTPGLLVQAAELG